MGKQVSSDGSREGELQGEMEGCLKGAMTGKTKEWLSIVARNKLAFPEHSRQEIG